MPKSNGESLSYENREACMADAREKGVSPAPCFELPKASGVTNTSMTKPIQTKKRAKGNKVPSVRKGY